MALLSDKQMWKETVIDKCVWLLSSSSSFPINLWSVCSYYGQELDENLWLDMNHMADQQISNPGIEQKPTADLRHQLLDMEFSMPSKQGSFWPRYTGEGSVFKKINTIILWIQADVRISLVWLSGGAISQSNSLSCSEAHRAKQPGRTRIHGGTRSSFSAQAHSRTLKLSVLRVILVSWVSCAHSWELLGGEKLATPQITTDSSKTTRSGPEEESWAVKFTDYSPDTAYNRVGAESRHFDTRSLDKRAFWSHLVGGWYVWGQPFKLYCLRFVFCLQLICSRHQQNRIFKKNIRRLCVKMCTYLVSFTGTLLCPRTR